MKMIVAIVMAVSLFGQTRGAPPDPISGTWTGEPDDVVFELNYDGKGGVSGRVTPQPGEIKRGTFDPKTGAFKLEGDTVNPAGNPCRFVIEGKIENGVAAGVATCGTQKVGDFKMTRR